MAHYQFWPSGLNSVSWKNVVLKRFFWKRKWYNWVMKIRYWLSLWVVGRMEQQKHALKKEPMKSQEKPVRRPSGRLGYWDQKGWRLCREDEGNLKLRPWTQGHWYGGDMVETAGEKLYPMTSSTALMHKSRDVTRMKGRREKWTSAGYVTVSILLTKALRYKHYYLQSKDKEIESERG